MEEILKHNEEFVARERHRDFQCSKFPAKKMAIVTCMDTRLVGLLEAALGLKPGDVKMIKNAGGLVTDPYGDTMRSLLVAVYELGVEKILIIPHTTCGVEGMKGDHFIRDMIKQGVTSNTIDEIKSQGIDLEKWLTGFTDTTQALEESIQLVRNHPLLPKGVTVSGYVIDTATGRLLS